MRSGVRSTELERVFEKVLGELDLATLTRNVLARAPRAGTPARVVAIGKAAPAMAAGAVERWGSAIESCLVVAPDNTDTDALLRSASRARISDRLTVLHAAHPFPDARSVVAARACLAAVTCEAPRSILVLVSGGASALVCAPSAGITLRDKQTITRAMLKSGASVQDVNVVRKHLSRIKGGGLLRAAAPNRVLTVIASDVIGGSPADVGSGPSVPDASTMVEARRLLRRHAPSFVDVPLVKTVSAAAMAGARPKVVASPEKLARVFARLLRETFDTLDVRVLPPSQASAEALAAEYVRLARRGSRPRAFVRGAEPSTLVPTRAGRGGRSTHVAALVGRALGAEPRGQHVVFGAFATDGVDGASTTGGAVIGDGFAAAVAHRLGPHALDRAIAAFDTGTLHRAMGTARPSAPTGHNLADLHVLVLSG
jgi:hydroxypyruvate reductase